jgi:hypothetical protein
VIEVSERTYRLRLRERDSVDAHEFEDAAVAALDESGADRRASLERAAAVWTGDPFPRTATRRGRLSGAIDSQRATPRCSAP